MNSFNPSNQVDKIDNKIIVALERVSEVFRILLWQESKKIGLSPIQIQIIIFILNHKSDLARISYLADEFNMSKATISDSVKVLEQKKFVLKKNNPEDIRIQSIHLTKEGKNLAQKVSKFTNQFEKILMDISDEKKKSLFNGLITLIETFHKTDILSAQRMCFTCKFYQKSKSKPYCNLLKSELTESDIRMDCDEHKPFLK